MCGGFFVVFSFVYFGFFLGSGCSSMYEGKKIDLFHTLSFMLCSYREPRTKKMVCGWRGPRTVNPLQNTFSVFKK